MKRLALILALVGCSTAAPAGYTVDNVAVFVNGEQRNVPLQSPDRITNVTEVLGACVKPDLSMGLVLRLGERCPDGWVPVYGHGGVTP